MAVFFVRIYHIVLEILKIPVKLITGKNKDALPDEQSEAIKEVVAQAAAVTSSKQRVVRDDSDEPLITFTYVIKNSFGQTVKSQFEAHSKQEVEAFLKNEGYEIISIEPTKAYNIEIKLGSGKLKSGDLSFTLTQLSTYIKAGIPLIDSMRILARQTIDPGKRKIYERVVYDLVMGENFSKALENQSSVFPQLLINMVKTSEMTGDLPSTLDEMSDYYTSIEATKKQMISALTYPCVIFLFAVIVVAFVLIVVVPSFVSMYASQDAALPAITLFTLAASDFLATYYVHLIIGIVLFILVFRYLYNNIKNFRRNVQIMLMKIPVVGDIIIYNEVTMFTKTFASLLNHSVFITDSMAILSKISNNEVYKEIIANTLKTLSKGGKISESFRGQWAFPVVAYEMLVTGESTGQLGTMMDKVADHFGNLHRNAISAVKSLVEPVTICFLGVAVGFILLSIIVPMFEVYNTVQ